MLDALNVAEEDVDDDEENQGMRVVADERRAQTAEHDIDRDPDGEEEARGDDVHPGKRIHSRRSSDYKTVISVSRSYQVLSG